MDNIDLLALVKTFGKLDGVELYGYISSRLPRPINLFDTCSTEQGGFFVKMDVLAVNLQKYSQYLKQMGITNKENDDIYLVNGSVALYVNSSNVFPDWYASRGTLRLGSKTDDFYLNMFQFRKDKNVWSISCNVLDTMEISNWGRQSRLYLSVNKSLENGFVTVPDDVAKLPHFNARLTQGIITPVQQTNGVSSSLADNLQSVMDGVVPQADISTTASNFEVIDRDTIIQPNDIYKKLKDNLKSIETSKDDFISSLKNDYSIEDEDDTKIRFLVNSLRVNLKTKPHNSASTGRVLLKKYLSKFGSYANDKYLGSTVGRYLIDSFSEVAEYILDSSSEVSVSGKAWKLCKMAFGDKEVFYAKILGIILGVDTDKMGDICVKCSDNGLSFVKIVTTNPYLLLLISSDFTYQEVDYIAYCLGIGLDDKDIRNYKLIGILYDYLNNNSSGSTVFKLSDVRSSKIGVTLTKAKYNQCMTSGTYLSETLRCNVYFYLDNTLTKKSYEYPSKGWISKGYSYTLPLSVNEIDLGLKLAIEHGLVMKFTKNSVVWVASQKLVEREIYICDVMYSLSEKKKGYDHKLIDKYIDEYEDYIGFKLEQKQRDAVHLIDNYVAVVTGPAGSGKTTVSDCMVFVLDKLGESNIEYAAPTGKAAKRLQEVVKEKVQTFNSKFKIFGGNDSLLDKEDSSSSNEKVIYFFDEVAMTNVNLMYLVCKNLENCSAFLLGDICQLPPIGKGLPFKNFLRFLPCVKLNVTKRSAENSGITYNSRVVNEFSERDNWQPLKEFDDFKILSCPDDEIKRITVLLCKYHLNKITPNEMTELCKLTGKTEDDFIKIPDLEPDDIQVVSPIGKATYSWGTHQLNTELQKVFNETKGYDKMFKYQVNDNVKGTRFAIGDRVIHTDSNMYSMQWYSSYKGGCFQKTYGFGIANGDVGKIVAFYPSQSCDFEDEDDFEPEDFEYPKNLRDDASFVDEGNWFIVVEYYDFMSDSNYYILYRATENQYVESNDCRAFTGDDLKKLNLFYAGTTHKMQGSQAKLIIGIFGTVNFKGFITRNMLYTEITRASEGVYLVGSVSSSKNSQVSIARQYVADDGVSTIQELLYT